MTAEVGILSLPELQNFVQYQQQQSQTLNWNLKQVSQKDGDISWEVKAFEQDSNNVTWPPRSYTCAYCSREFRSAQALGGHMNVHRRDRARLHQAPPPPPPPAVNNPFSFSPLLIQAQQVVTNDGLCIFYSLPKHNGDLNLMAPKASTNLMISKLISANHFPATQRSYNTLPSESNIHGHNNLSNMQRNMVIEEIDLELRLGRR